MSGRRPAIASTTTMIATRPKVLSRRSRLRGGCSSMVDEGVDTEDEIADEVGHEDEQKPPAPPEEVWPQFAQLDHRQVQREHQRQENERGTWPRRRKTSIVPS